MPDLHAEQPLPPHATTALVAAPAAPALHSAVDEAPFMLWTTDPEGHVTFVNQRWLAFTGRPFDQEVGLGWMEGVHSRDRETLSAEWQSGIQSGAPFTLEFRVRHAEGQHRWVLTHGAPRSGIEATAAVGYLVLAIERVGRDETASAAAHLHLQESEDQMRRLAARVQTAREEERAALARELHDELGQTLTAIKLELGRASAAINKQPLGSSVVDRLQSLIGLVEIGIATVKRITTDLRPATLDHLGLAAAIRWEAMTFRARTGLRCHIRATRDETSLSSESQTVLFRIFQEALTNVVRHANASAVHVNLARKRGAVELQIRDNGRGITEARRTDAGSVGLLGMRERAALIGGTFSVEGRRGKGTTVTVRVPGAAPAGTPAAARSRGPRTERRKR